MEKIIGDSELRAKYQHDLEANRANEVFDQITKDEGFAQLGIENCMKEVEMKWTDDLANSMKANWRKELAGTELAETNDLDKYCNCVMTEFRKYPLNEVMDDKFDYSDTSSVIREKCINESKK